MKKRMITLAVALMLMLSFASCGAGVDTATDIAKAETTTAAPIETTAAKAAVEVVTKADQPTTTAAATTNKAQPTTKNAAATAAKKNNSAKAQTPAKTTKKAASSAKKAQPAATTKAQTGSLTKEDILWAQQKANEYIKTLPKAKFNPSASGYSSESGAPWGASWAEQSGSQLYSRFKRTIDSEYQRCLDNEWNGIELYLDVSFNEIGWDYRCMYTVL